MFKKFPRCARPFVKKFLRKILENKLNLDGGDLAEKNSLTIVKRVAAECFFELNRHVLMKSLRVNCFRDDVTKTCEKNVYQINFAKIIFQSIFWDGSINVIFWVLASTFQ